jgi:hypothetical protein
MIYEGANGVQAMDLVGRKLAANGGRGLRAFLSLLATVSTDARADARLAPLADTLDATAAQLQEATMWLMQNGLSNPNEAGAGATAYLDLLALAAFGTMWLTMARAAQNLVDAGTDNDAWLQNKLLVARHYFERAMPEAPTLLARLKAGSRTLMAFPAEAF